MCNLADVTENIYNLDDFIKALKHYKKAYGNLTMLDQIRLGVDSSTGGKGLFCVEKLINIERWE